MDTLYNRPRIKPIYPLYRLNRQEFRIGAQLGITAEFGDPEGQLWELASKLDGRPVMTVIEEVREVFPELTVEDVIDGIQLLDNDGISHVSFVDIDFDEYRRKTDNKTVRRNVTLPNWLNQEAEKSHINVSRVLQEALMVKLGVSR